MNYVQLQQAILDDSHRDDYVNDPVQRFIAEGEARIFAKLEAYMLTLTINDAIRVGTTGEYTIAGKLVDTRYVLKSDGSPPLTRGDETLASYYSSSSNSSIYVPRPQSILIAGTPAVGATFTLMYLGLPAALAVTPTNTLLDENPQLYKNAALVSLYQRAQMFDAGAAALQDMIGLINELNRAMKKKLSGRTSAPSYNTAFRSSY